MSARRNISQRTAPPQSVNTRQQAPPPSPAGRSDDGVVDIKKMHPMAVLSLHEDRLNEIDEQLSQIQSKTSQTQQTAKRSAAGDESAMIAECIKQIKFLTQENQTNRNLARELTLELLRLKTSLQEDGRIEMHISEEAQDKYEAFKETANANAVAAAAPSKTSASVSVREELMSGSGDTVSFSGNGGYDPNSL